MLTPKPPNTKLSVFLLVYWYIGLSAIRIFLCFSRHNSRKLWQTTCIENRDGFAVHSSTWPSGAKGEWRVSSWLAISTRVKEKKMIFFHVCFYGFSQGRKSLYNTAVYVITWKNNLNLKDWWTKWMMRLTPDNIGYKFLLIRKKLL